MPKREQTTLPVHGALVLPSVEVDSYNLEVEDEEGFVGDRASRRAFRDILERWREPLRKLGGDPLGEEASDKISDAPRAAVYVPSDEIAGFWRKHLGIKR